MAWNSRHEPDPKREAAAGVWARMLASVCGKERVWVEAVMGVEGGVHVV